MPNKKPWYELPERKPPDMRDSEEHVAVAAALEALPAGHPARVAYAEGVDTITLTHLVADHPAVITDLTEAYLAGYCRSLQRWGSHFRP